MRRLLAVPAAFAILAIVAVAAALAAVEDLGEQRRLDTNVDPGYGAKPTLAYNSNRNEYLVVWISRGLDDDDIFGRIVAPGGAPVGDQFRISSMGPDGDGSYAANDPTVTYNPTADEYLVAWTADDNTAPLVNDEYEIFTQRLSATGAQVGADDARISSMGPNGSTSFRAEDPSAAYNATANEYLVTWSGDDNAFPLVDDEYEIFAQRLSATGAEVGTDDQRLSTMGADQNSDHQAFEPSAAVNPLANEYLIVWSSDDDTASQVNDEYEIFAQRLSASGEQVGGDDERISTVGPALDARYGAYGPQPVFNPADNEYLVAWSGGGDPPLEMYESEVFVQRLAADGTEVGTDDQRISAMGPDGDRDYSGYTSAPAYNPVANEYLVAWQGTFDPPPADDVSKPETFAQRLSAAGAEIGTDDKRISVMGPDDQGSYFANAGSVAFGATANEYMFAWYGSDGPPRTSGVFGRAMAAPDPPPTPPQPDATLDGGTIEIAKKLKIKGKDLKIKLTAGCAESCNASASGAVTTKGGKAPANLRAKGKTKRYALAPVAAASIAGQKAKLTLKLKGSKSKRKRATRKIVASIGRGAKARASIAVTLTDSSGNSAVVDGSAKLKR